jgi:hypothetical protein
MGGDAVIFDFVTFMLLGAGILLVVWGLMDEFKGGQDAE